MGDLTETPGTWKIRETRNGDIGTRTWTILVSDMESLPIVKGRSKFTDGLTGFTAAQRRKYGSYICVEVTKDGVGCGDSTVSPPYQYVDVVATYSTAERTEMGKPRLDYQGRTEILDTGPGSYWADGSQMNQENLIKITKGVFTYRRTMVSSSRMIKRLDALQGTTNKDSWLYWGREAVLFVSYDWNRYYNAELDAYLMDLCLNFEVNLRGWNMVYQKPEQEINANGIVVYTGAGGWVNYENYPLGNFKNLPVVLTVTVE